ncbi:unnamed protein product, partial [Pylaiella littoralis]
FFLHPYTSLSPPHYQGITYPRQHKMDSVSLASDRSGIPLLQKIGQQLLTHLDTAVSSNNNNPIHQPDTSSYGIYIAPSGRHQEEAPVHRQEEHRCQHQQYIPPDPFPLGLLPEDVRPNVFSFLPARVLASVRRASSDYLHAVDRHADALWGNLCRCDFPSMESPTTAGIRERAHLSPHQ